MNVEQGISNYEGKKNFNIQNSMFDILRFKINKKLKSEENKIQNLLKKETGESIYYIRENLRKIMFDCFGVFRTENKMKEGIRQIEKIKKRFENVYIKYNQKTFNQALVHSLELEYMIVIAEAIGKGALERRESRGSHFRTDYPKRNDNDFLCHTMAYYHNGQIKLEYEPVKLGIYPVKERVY